MSAEEDEVIKVEPQEMVRVQICFRKRGQPSAADPHGTVKLEVLQPRSAAKSWESARQFPGTPNINVVIEGRLIQPTLVGKLALGGDEDAPLVVQDAEIEALAVRRESLRVDISRLEATLQQLTLAHLRTRQQYSEEEVRLQTSLGTMGDQLKALRESYSKEEQLVHDRVAKVLEMELAVTDSLTSRIKKYDADLTDAVNREVEVANEVEELRAKARVSQEGSFTERILARGEKNIAAMATHPLGQRFLGKLLSFIPEGNRE